MKKNHTILSIIAILFIGASTATLNVGCKSSGADISTVEKVALYYLKDLPPVVDQGTVDAYFDFSDCMEWAYKNDTTKTILSSLVNKLPTHARVFKMANDTVEPLALKQTELYDMILDPKSYHRGSRAPIEKTLECIVSNKNEALLVTDFEEYSGGKIHNAAFAKDYFKTWLDEIGDITFYVTPYVENGDSKKLYYIVFSNRNHELRKKMEDALNSCPKNYSTFLFATNPWKITTNYLGAAYGGNYHDPKTNEDIVSGTVEKGDCESYCNFNQTGYEETVMKGLRFLEAIPQFYAEYYPFEASWEDIVKNSEAMKDLSLPINQRYTDLLRNLFIDLSIEDSYIISKLGVAVYDVQSDMDNYINSQIAQARKPDMIDDGQGGKIADLSDGLNAYYDEKGSLLPAYIYQRQKPEIIKDMFEVNQTLFSQSKESDPSKTEIGIDLKDGFSGKIAGYTQGDMIRIDVYIDECDINTGKIRELFSWDTQKNGHNDCLEMSILNVLQELNPSNKNRKSPIYSFFIKTL